MPLTAFEITVDTDTTDTLKNISIEDIALVKEGEPISGTYIDIGSFIVSIGVNTITLNKVTTGTGTGIIATVQPTVLIQCKYGEEASIPNSSIGEPIFANDTNQLYIGTGLSTPSVNVTYTDARARLALSGTSPISYNNLTGVISLETNYLSVSSDTILTNNQYENIEVDTTAGAVQITLPDASTNKGYTPNINWSAGVNPLTVTTSNTFNYGTSNTIATFKTLGDTNTFKAWSSYYQLLGDADLT